MPLSKYNSRFGGKSGSAAKAKAAMQKQYGAEKGEQVFYATVNKRKGRGVKSHMPHGMYKNMRGGDVGKMRGEEAAKAGAKWGNGAKICEASKLLPNRAPKTER